MKSLLRRSNRLHLALILVLSLLLLTCACNSTATTGSTTAAPAATTGSGTAAATTKAGNANGFPLSDKLITMKMTIAANPDYNPNSNMWFFQEMKKKTNVEYQIEHVSTNSWNERKNLMFAASELPDVIVGGLTNTEIITYMKAKQILPITDLVKANAPNYLKVLDKFPDEAGKLYDPSGNMVGLAGTITGGFMEVPGARAFINEQWLKNLGLKMPETYDDFYKAMVAFRDSDPNKNGLKDEIPLSGYSGYSIDPFVAGPLGIPFGWGSKSEWIERSGKIVYLATDSIYKEYLVRMNKLFTEKLLDQEYYTQNDAQMKAKGQKLQIGAYTYAAPFVLVSSTDPAIYGQFAAIEPMTSEFFKTKAWYGNHIGSPNIFITSVNKYQKETIRYFDYFYSEEGGQMFYGPEVGKWEGQGGVKWNDNHTSWSVQVPDGYVGIFAWLSKVVSPIGSGIQGNWQYTEYCSKQTMTPEDRVLYDTMNKHYTPYMKASFPPSLFLTSTEEEEVSLIKNDLATYVKQMEAKYVMGEEPLSSFDTFSAKLKTMGVEKLTKVYQGAYDRYLASSKK